MKKLLAMLGSCGLAACGTIDQAPLVYVSANTFGVLAAGGTADTPGAKVVIGYHAIDAAFVPTAFGRRCSVQAGIECGSTSYPIMPLLGGNSVSDAMFVDLIKSKAAAYAGAEREAKARLDELDRARQDLARADAAGAELKGAKEALAALNPPAPALVPGAAIDPSAPAAPPLDQATKDRITAFNAIAAAAKPIADGRDALVSKASAAEAAYRAAFTTAEAEQRSLDALRNLNSAETGKRSDALSVYGSFDGNAGVVDRTKVSLDLGKSFSTGVAAQQLTDGLGKAARIKAIADCLTAAHNAATNKNSETDLVSLAAGVAACQTKT